MNVVLNKKCQKQFCKLDKQTQKRIGSFLDELETLENPRTKGKGLVANLSGFWRYRVGNYRIVCEIRDEELIILCLNIDTRDKIY